MYQFIIALIHMVTCVAGLTTPVSLVNTHTFLERTANKKLITLSPGGLAGFYMLGVVTYIQENYDTSDFQILGASAGAWNALPMVYNGPINDVVQDILCNYRAIDGDGDVSSIQQLQRNIQELITTNYKEDDFDLERINIATTRVIKTGFEQLIICDITTLQQATDSCIASSHIPFVSGKVPKINNKRLYDGGFQKFPPENIQECLNITPNMWETNQKEEYHELLNIKNLHAFESYYEKGFKDSQNNRDFLHSYLSN